MSPRCSNRLLSAESWLWLHQVRFASVFFSSYITLGVFMTSWMSSCVVLGVDVVTPGAGSLLFQVFFSGQSQLSVGFFLRETVNEMCDWTQNQFYLMILLKPNKNLYHSWYNKNTLNLEFSRVSVKISQEEKFFIDYLIPKWVILTHNCSNISLNLCRNFTDLL